MTRYKNNHTTCKRRLKQSQRDTKITTTGSQSNYKDKKGDADHKEAQQQQPYELQNQLQRHTKKKTLKRHNNTDSKQSHKDKLQRDRMKLQRGARLAFSTSNIICRLCHRLFCGTFRLFVLFPVLAFRASKCHGSHLHAAPRTASSQPIRSNTGRLVGVEIKRPSNLTTSGICSQVWLCKWIYVYFTFFELVDTDH